MDCGAMGGQHRGGKEDVAPLNIFAFNPFLGLGISFCICCACCFLLFLPTPFLGCHSHMPHAFIYFILSLGGPTKASNCRVRILSPVLIELHIFTRFLIFSYILFFHREAQLMLQMVGSVYRRPALGWHTLTRIY